MPLSEHEQKLLDELEHDLLSGDPKFAAIMRGAEIKNERRRRVARLVTLFIAGIVGLLAGAVFRQPLVGVGGFLVMLVAGLGLVRTVQRASARRGSETRKKAKGPRPSFTERLETRWRHRWDNRDR